MTAAVSAAERLSREERRVIDYAENQEPLVPGEVAAESDLPHEEVRGLLESYFDVSINYFELVLQTHPDDLDAEELDFLYLAGEHPKASKQDVYRALGYEATPSKSIWRENVDLDWRARLAFDTDVVADALPLDRVSDEVLEADGLDDVDICHNSLCRNYDGEEAI